MYTKTLTKITLYLSHRDLFSHFQEQSFKVLKLLFGYYKIFFNGMHWKLNISMAWAHVAFFLPTLFTLSHKKNCRPWCHLVMIKENHKPFMRCCKKQTNKKCSGKIYDKILFKFFERNLSSVVIFIFELFGVFYSLFFCTFVIPLHFDSLAMPPSGGTFIQVLSSPPHH